MSNRPRTTTTWVQIARRIILACALLIALALFLGPVVGPVWVLPKTADGQPLCTLPIDHPEYVSERAPQYSLAVFLLCLALWVTNAIPLAATGLLALSLLPLLGVVSAKQSFAYFGNSAVFFIIGVFLLAAAMIETGLSKRLTLLLLRRFDRHPGLLVAGVTFSSSFLAMWMPEHAVAAMMFPLILEIAGCLNLEKGRSGYAKSLFFGLAFGAAAGGCATLLGGARAPLAIELLKDTYRTTGGVPLYAISFLEWMKAAMPCVVLMTILSAVFIRVFIPWEISDITAATRMLRIRVRELGPMSAREKRLAVLGIITIGCWVYLGHSVDLAVISIASAAALFAFRIVRWQAVQGYVNWGVVIMYGGAIAVGSALKDTQAMLWIVERVVPSQQVSPTWMLIIMTTLTICLSAVISNVAAVAVVLPVGFALCEAATPAIHPMAMTYAIAISAGLAYALPISAPPIAICYASGYYGMKEVPKYGIPLTAIALGCVILLIVAYWPIVGIPVTLSP